VGKMKVVDAPRAESTAEINLSLSRFLEKGFERMVLRTLATWS